MPLNNLERAELARDTLGQYTQYPELPPLLEFFQRRRGGALSPDLLVVDLLVDLSHLERRAGETYGPTIQTLRGLLERTRTPEEWLAARQSAGDLFAHQTLGEEIEATLTQRNGWMSQAVGDNPACGERLNSPGSSESLVLLFEGADAWEQGALGVLDLLSARFIVNDVHGTRRNEEEGWFACEVRRARKEENSAAPRS